MAEEQLGQHAKVCAVAVLASGLTGDGYQGPGEVRGGWVWTVDLGIWGKVHRVRTKPKSPDCLAGVRKGGEGLVCSGGCGLQRPLRDKKAPVLSEVLLLTP